MKLINYLPKFLQNVVEYKELMNAETIEIETIKAEINNFVDEVSIQNATEAGIKKYEKILNINNDNNLLLEERKLLIKNKFFNRPPFSLQWLNNKLMALCGKNNYEIDLDYQNLILNIQIGYLFKEATEELTKDLKNIVPANLKLNVNFWYVENIKQNQVIATHQTETLIIKQIN